ncbi:S-methyl-5-thioribose-1-phosphate isomerase [bacterium]|nr:S-methyl-5-thioribose-1-phosphate isomerase [bacterium]
MPVETIRWSDGDIVIIDQTLLPETCQLLTLTSVEMVAEAIRSLRVRGAPAIGIAGAMGMALAAHGYRGCSAAELRAELAAVSEVLAATRPTAVNLFWALNRIGQLIASVPDADVATLRQSILREAQLILEEDRAACRAMGRNGAALLPDECTVLTHCNAGGLATGDFGTALGVIYAAAEAGKRVRVFADETRPLLQGSRLTAWELRQSGIEVTVLCDNAAGSLLASGAIDAVIVGADRIAANGDTANKIGTYPLSVLAREHTVPFYVVAPTSTIDPAIATGADIPIEFRSGEEIGNGFGRRTAPEGVHYYNPAFDVTPAANITAIITERKVEHPPYLFSFR